MSEKRPQIAEGPRMALWKMSIRETEKASAHGLRHKGLKAFSGARLREQLGGGVLAIAVLPLLLLMTFPVPQYDLE